MNILIIGLGVIGTTYGYLFKKAGFNVEHYIRKNSSKNNIDKLNIELLDGRTNAKGEASSDEYIVNKATRNEYDFIFVAVSSGKIAGVIDELKNENISGTLVFGCGIWEERSYIDNITSGWNYILGYPVAGGNIENQTLNCCVFDHFMLEQKEKANISNYDDIESVFKACNIKLEQPYDMLEWIWLHMAINAGVVSVAGSYGDIKNASTSAENLMDSAKRLSEAVRSIRETSKIIESRGVKLKNYNNELFAYKLPTIISAPIMKKMFRDNILTRKIMTLHGNLDDLLFVCKSVYDKGKENNISAPLFYGNYEKVIEKISSLS